MHRLRQREESAPTGIVSQENFYKGISTRQVSLDLISQSWALYIHRVEPYRQNVLKAQMPRSYWASDSCC